MACAPSRSYSPALMIGDAARCTRSESIPSVDHWLSPRHRSSRRKAERARTTPVSAWASSLPSSNASLISTGHKCTAAVVRK